MQAKGQGRDLSCLAVLLPCVRRSFLDEAWFLRQKDPLRWGHESTPEELKLALLVFEEMQLCLRVGWSMLPLFSSLSSF